MADAPWSSEDSLLFQQLAFEISDDVHDKWERIAHELDRPVTSEELKQRYTDLYRDLWLIERGQVTWEMHMAGQEAAGAAAGEGVAGGRGRGEGVARGRGRRARAPSVPWSVEEIAIINNVAGQNDRQIGPDEYPILEQRLPHRTPAAIRGYLRRNGGHYYQIGGAQG